MGDSEKLLAQLISESGNKRENRSLELLRNPNGQCPKGWSLYLPKAFNAALDIAQTQRVVERQGNKEQALEWTQGSTFSFSAGDILYDTEAAYQRWDKALQEIGVCFEVVRAASASPQQRGQPRYPGQVVLKIRKPAGDRNKLVDLGEVEVTQDDLVRFAVSGKCKEIGRVLGRIF